MKWTGILVPFMTGFPPIIFGLTSILSLASVISTYPVIFVRLSSLKPLTGLEGKKVKIKIIDVESIDAEKLYSYLRLFLKNSSEYNL